VATRRERLEQMLAESPADSFLRYGLAMELAKEGRHDESLGGLRGLMQEVPPYVPAFFMAGQQLAQLGRLEEARDVLRAGIESAREQGNLHAAGEMGEFLANLGSWGP
jgi:tetratricopeptide (TPR) repeat protein